jgi:hypothetical protein
VTVCVIGGGLVWWARDSVAEWLSDAVMEILVISME